MLKAVLGKLRIPEAERYIAHASRRGTSQDLKESGSPWSAVATSGLWHSPPFRGYLDMSRDVLVVSQQLFDIDCDPASADE